jgi:hypothetical protein
LVTSRNELQATADAYNLIIYIFGANSTEDATIISNGGVEGGFRDQETIFVVHYGEDHYKAAYDIKGNTNTASLEGPTTKPNNPEDPDNPQAQGPHDPQEEPREPRDVFAVMDTRLAGMGMKAVEVGGGGDCFFCTLAAQHPELLYDPANYSRARASTVRHLRAHRDLYSPFVPYNDHIRTFDEYLDYMSQQGAWVEGGIEILAAAATWNVNIHIYGENELHDRIIDTPNPDMYTRDIFVAHYHDFHYRVVRYA